MGPTFSDSLLDRAFPPAQVQEDLILDLDSVIGLSWQTDVFAEANIEAFITFQKWRPLQTIDMFGKWCLL